MIWERDGQFTQLEWTPTTIPEPVYANGGHDANGQPISTSARCTALMGLVFWSHCVPLLGRRWICLRADPGIQRLRVCAGCQ